MESAPQQHEGAATATDPVCGMSVDTDAGKPSLEKCEGQIADDDVAHLITQR